MTLGLGWNVNLAINHSSAVGRHLAIGYALVDDDQDLTSYRVPSFGDLSYVGLKATRLEACTTWSVAI